MPWSCAVLRRRLAREEARLAALEDRRARQPAPRPRAARAAKRAAPPEPPAGYPLTEHDDFGRRLRAGQVGLAEFRAQFERLRARQDDARAELARLTREQLRERLSGYAYSDATKDRLVAAALDELAMVFMAGEALAFMSGDHRTVIEHVAEHVPKVTEAKLRAYAETIARQQREREEERARLVARIKNPRTLEDFDLLIRLRGEQVMTPELRARRDELVAVQSAPRRGEAGDFAVHAERWSGRDVFRVRGPHVEDDLYRQLLAAARELGGRYIARRGFSFFDRPSADAFADRARAIAADATPVDHAAARADRLQTRAAALVEEAEEIAHRPRLANTPKRVREAAAQELRAASMDATAKTMERLADAVRDGRIKHLRNVSARTHVELLNKLLRYTQTWREQQDSKPIGPENVERVEYPWPGFPADWLRRLCMEVGGRPGLRRASARLLEYAGRHEKNGIVDLETPQAIGDIVRIRDALRPGKDFESRHAVSMIGDRLEDYNRLQRLGITTIEALRAALREYLACCYSRRIGPDPLKEAERALVGQNIAGYFPTPRELADEVAEDLELAPGLRVLEPSAGKGDLAAAMLRAEPEIDLKVIERSETLRRVLELRGLELVDRDFLEHRGRYDRIGMNPPFEENQDSRHVRHAYDLLEPGGVLVAIMSAGTFHRQGRVEREFRDWLARVGGTVRDNDPDAFEKSDRPTSTPTVTVKIRKDGRHGT